MFLFEPVNKPECFCAAEADGGAAGDSLQVRPGPQSSDEGASLSAEAGAASSLLLCLLVLGLPPRHLRQQLRLPRQPQRCSLHSLTPTSHTQPPFNHFIRFCLFHRVFKGSAFCTAEFGSTVKEAAVFLSVLNIKCQRFKQWS